MKRFGAVSYVCLCLYATFTAGRSYCPCRSLPNLRAWRSSHLCRHLVTWRWGKYPALLFITVCNCIKKKCPGFRWCSVKVFVTWFFCCPFSVIVCAKTSAHVEPQRGAVLCGYPESPQRRGREAGDGDAKAGGEAASGLEHAAHRSRWGNY